MSLLSPSVRIALTPHRVAVASRRDHREAAVQTPGWAGALEALSGLLAGAGLPGRVSVVLSHHFAPVHLLPSPPVALKPLEMQGWIRDRLVQQSDETNRDSRVTWQPEPPGEPFIVSSVEPARLAELEGVLRAASLKAVEVQPWLASAWKRQRRQLGRGRAWYALVEPGRMTLLGLDGGHARSLRSAPVQGDVVAALAGLLTREAFLAGEETPAPVWIDCAALRPDWQPLLPGGALDSGHAVHVLPPGREALGALVGA